MSQFDFQLVDMGRTLGQTSKARRMAAACRHHHLRSALHAGQVRATMIVALTMTTTPAVGAAIR